MLNLADLAKFSMFFARLQKLKPDRPKKVFSFNHTKFWWVGGWVFSEYSVVRTMLYTSSKAQKCNGVAIKMDLYFHV